MPQYVNKTWRLLCGNGGRRQKNQKLRIVDKIYPAHWELRTIPFIIADMVSCVQCIYCIWTKYNELNIKSRRPADMALCITYVDHRLDSIKFKTLAISEVGAHSIRLLPRPFSHDDVIKWKHFLRYWPFVRGIHRWPVSSPHKANDAQLWGFLWPVWVLAL